MSLNASVKVPLPERGIVRRKVSGKTYIYYAVATYRDENGKPTNDRVSIGKLDEESGMLIPNRNYYEIYKNQPAPQMTAIHDFGVGYAFEEIAKKTRSRVDIETLLPRALQGNSCCGAVYAK